MQPLITPVPGEPRPLDFRAVVQVGSSNQLTATVCPLGDGHPGGECYLWTGRK